MASRRYCGLVIILITLLLGLAAVVVSVLTDAWFRVDAGTGTSRPVQTNWTYVFGLWRRCYNKIPDEIPIAQRTGNSLNCVELHKELLPPEPEKLDADDRLHLILSWAVILGACLCALFQLSTILSLICGAWPGRSKEGGHCCLYFGASLLTLLASMLGITSGICFMALRSLDESRYGQYPAGVTSSYYWSFGLLWGGTGITFLDGFFLLCLVWRSYDTASSSKYAYFDM